MKKRVAWQKTAALLLVLVMVLSLAACGDKDGKKEEDTPAAGTENPEKKKEDKAEVPDVDTEAEVPEGTDTVPEGALTFSDGLYGFIAQDTSKGNADESELSIVDYNGGKALKVTNKNGGVPFIAVDASSLLGDRIADVRSMVFDIGTENPDGEFYAASGFVYAYSGTTRVESKDAWSVYLENKNPKTTTAKLDNEGEYFVAGAKNFFVVTLETDNGKDAKKAPANMFLSNIRFLDKDGSVIPADTKAGFDAPDGFGAPDLSNLTRLMNETPVEGFPVSAGAWAQAGVNTVTNGGTFDASLIQPGSILRIYYTGGGDMWLVGVSGGNPNGDWMRIADGGQSVKNDSMTIAQITYDQIVAVLGEDFASTLSQLQCESDADWEVSKLTIGQDAGLVNLKDTTEIEGFAVSADGWAQAGVNTTANGGTFDASLLKPGCIVEIDYSSEGAMWMVAISNGNEKGDWMRVADGGQTKSDGKTAQISYEQITAVLGEDFAGTLTQLQCEGEQAWEVYSVKIGYPAE